MTTRRERVLANMALLLGLAGAGVGGVLTRTKFQMVATPCLVAGPGCRLTETIHCGAALSDRWSELLWLPLSLWGSALFLVAAALGGGAGRDTPSAGPARSLLFVVASVALLVSAALAIRMAVVLKALCPYCVALYLISAGLWGVALALRRAPTRASAARVGVNTIFISALLFVFSVGVQGIAYRVALTLGDPREGCPDVRERLPETPLVFGAAEAKVVLALFLDPSCSHCRATFEVLRAALQGGDLEGAQLHIFLVPRAGCSSERPVPLVDDVARRNKACVAAGAVLCADHLDAGAGLAALQAILQLQTAPDGRPWFEVDKIEFVLRAAQLPSNRAWRTCVDEPKTARTIAEHQGYLLDVVWKDKPEQVSVPALLALPVRAGGPVLADLSHVPTDSHARLVETIRRNFLGGSHARL